MPPIRRPLRLLALTTVAPGLYSRLRLTLSAPLPPPGDAVIDAPAATLDLPLSKPLVLKAKENQSLFITWDVAATLAGNGQGRRFRPVLAVGPQSIPLTTELAFVSCPEIRTIYIVRTDTNTICGSWGLAGRPTYLAAFKSRDRLLALLADKAAVADIEISSGRIRDLISIPGAIAPSFMVLDDEAANAFILDRQTNYLLKLDLKSGGITGRRRLTDQPGFLTFLHGRNQVAVSSALARKIFLIDGDSLETLSVITSASGPEGLYFSGSTLYVAEGKANTVLVHDVNSGRDDQRQVGRRPSRFAAGDGYVFVANHGAATVAALLPDRLNVARTIKVGRGPEEMAISTTRNWLYVAETGDSGLGVIDLTSLRAAHRITLPAAPLDIEVIQ